MRFITFRKILLLGAIIICSSIIANAQSLSQKYIIGGRFGLSIGDGDAGLQIGPTGEYFFNNNMGISSDLNINTQTGTPVEWNVSYNYMLDATDQRYRPYFDGGMSLWFSTGGPYFGLRFGGGVDFKIAPNMYVPADAQFGPVFGSGSSTFYFALTSGIRYVLP
jgi:hypothetical protein